MGNFANIDIERVEILPKRNKVRPPNVWRRYGEDYPWKKVYRFLMSRVGNNWNDVFSEYCHLDWVPHQYKTKEQIGHSVILNTFFKDNKVWYYDRYSSDNERPIDEICDLIVNRYFYRDECFYVHPGTGELLYKHRKESRKKQRKNSKNATMVILGDYHQLLKVDGIWYEVKGEKFKRDDVIEIDGLHYKKVNHPELDSSPSQDKKNKIEYKIVDGKYYIPDRGEWRYSGRDIGPRDPLVAERNEIHYWRRNLNTEAVKLTIYRQLNRKELKQHGLHNDVKIQSKCSVCGGLGCMLKHN